jgi:hypothetical protein
MMLSGGANLFSAAQWQKDPLGNLLKSSADLATGLTVVLGSITALAGLIIALMSAITLLSLGTAAPVTGPIIAFCATVLTTVGAWTIAVGKVALVLQGLVLIKNLIDAACATTAEQLQNQSDKISQDVGNAGNVLLQMGMAKLGQVGGRAMQAEIAEVGGVAFARQMGQQGFVATAASGIRRQGLGGFTRGMLGKAWSGTGAFLRGTGRLFTRRGAADAARGTWRGLKAGWRELWADRPRMSLREGLSRRYLVGEKPPVAAAEGAGVARPGAATAVPERAPSPEAPVSTPESAAPPVKKASDGPRVEGPAETPTHREASVRESGHIESDQLGARQLRSEADYIAEHPELLEGSRPHRRARIGEHEWRENEAGGWCRFSNNPLCLDEKGQLPARTGEGVAGVTPERHGKPVNLREHLPEDVQLVDIAGKQQHSIPLDKDWRRAAAELTQGEHELLYALRDARTGEILKIGKTESGTLIGRAEKYATAGSEQYANRELVMDIVSIKAPEGSSLGTVENQARASMEASITQEWGGTQGPQGQPPLRWDNTEQRLGYKGPGTPGVRTREMREKGLYWEGERVVSEAGAGPMPVRPSSVPSRDQLVELLQRHNGNVAEVAKALGKSEGSVYYYVQKQGLELSSFRVTSTR